MSEPEALADRLAALRVAAIEATRPPGVAAVRRTVARRDARRTLAGGFVVLLLAVAYVFFGATGGEPAPVMPSTAPPRVSPSSVEVPPSTVEGTTTAPTSSSAVPPRQYAYGCKYGENGGPLIMGGDELH